jgi:hypothetical protein
MRQRAIFYATAILIALAISILVLLLSRVLPLFYALPFGLSLLALIVSVLSSFKNELFPFRLSVYSNGLHLVTTAALPTRSGTSIGVLLPVTFINQGYAEGVVEYVALVIRTRKGGFKWDFLPVAEIDMKAFVQQNKGPNATNTLGFLVGFVLESKRALEKNILFAQKMQPDSSPLVWQPDEYTFEIYVKTLGERKPRRLFAFRQEIRENTLRLLATGKAHAVYLYPDQLDELSSRVHFS